MSIQSRIALYDKIEAIRKRPLIVYATSPRFNAGGKMGNDAIPEICDQIAALPADCHKVDLLIVSGGGDPMVAWRTISMLREKVDEISVLVPYAAYSAATLLALGADDIIMHPFANLGPIDPQIESQRKGKDGNIEAIHFGSEDMEGFLDFARNKVGISDQANMLEVFKLFCAEAGPIPIGIATRSSQLSVQLGIKLLQTRKRMDRDDRKAKAIVDRLNKKYFNHGYALSRREAKEIGLKVIYPQAPLEQAMWDVWKEIETDIKARIPFVATTIVADDPQMKDFFAPPSSLNLPSNTPPQVAQQIWQSVLQQILSNPLANYPEIGYNKACAVLESKRLQRMYVERGKIVAFKGPSGPSISAQKISSGWCDSIDAAT